MSHRFRRKPRPTSPHDDMLACRTYVQRALMAFDRKKVTTTEEHDAQLREELTVVAAAANDWALVNGYDEIVAFSDVERIDRGAQGHVDWFDKLTLRVADLVVYGRG